MKQGRTLKAYFAKVYCVAQYILDDGLSLIALLAASDIGLGCCSRRSADGWH
jgi:hypothetical protein